MSTLVMNRRLLAGVSLALMTLSTLYVGLIDADLSYKDSWPSGLLAAVASFLLFPDTKLAQRIQLAALVGVGLVLLLLALREGAVVYWPALLSQNTGMLAMLFSVGLLKLIVTTAASAKTKLPVGRKAFLHTIISVTSLGSIINISALIVVADRMSLNRPLSYFSAGTAVRSFSACAAWSPFFAGMAVVLTAVGEEHLHAIMAYGLPLTLMFVLVLYVSGVLLTPKKVDAFQGYPIKLESFFVPVSLAVMVFVCNLIFPSMHILSVIAISAIVLSCVVLFMRQGLQSTHKRMREYIHTDLPSMVGELQLFLSAGVLAFGLQALVEAGTLSSPIDALTGGTACLLLAALLLGAAIGVHPVIPIASITPILSVVNPDPVLLGLTYLFGWSLGTCISPLSGTNMVMQGRFGINALRGALQNMPYMAVLYCVACIILMIRASVSG